MLGIVVVLAIQGCQGDVIRFDENVDVTVTLRGDGDGLVRSLDPQVYLECQRVDGEPLGCEVTFYDAGGGGEFQLLATPEPGSEFSGWTGDCSGASDRCTLSFAEPAGGEIVRFSVTATFLLTPGQIQVTLAESDLELGQATQATASATASGTLFDLEYEWHSSDPTVASVSVSSSTSTATVRALGPGEAVITARARGVVSDPVTVTVAEPAPEPGTLRGTVFDTDGVTGLEGLVVRIGGPTVTTPRTTDADGKYGAADLTAGAYTLYVQGRQGFRFMSSEQHDVGVTAGGITVEDVNIKEGNYLEILSDTSTAEVASGAEVSITVEFRTWSREGCPGCVPALILGVEGEPMVLHRFGTPGPFTSGGGHYTPTLQFPAPAQGGSLYAMLVTGISTDTEGGQDLARAAYRDRFASGLWEETFIPIGTLKVQ